MSNINKKKLLEQLTSEHSDSKRLQIIRSLRIRTHRGTGRITIPISKNRVLKVAYNQKGIAQNSQEWDFYMHGAYPFNRFFARTYNTCPFSHWIIQERVTDAKRKWNLNFQEIVPKSLLDHLTMLGFCLADLDQFGSTKGRKVVIYDYGLTWDIYDAVYL